MRPQQGTRLGDRYVLTTRIAVGGMGEVWRGQDTVLAREVAAKIMKEEYRDDAGFLARFRSEARSMGAVSHPGIAAVYDYGEENGAPYLVMEYVPGEALSAILDRNGGLPERDALDIVAQAAEALDAAHNAGVVHRDIKPGNLLITPNFRVKITDFGIARVADQAPLTKTGQVMGTAQYLAPEQATGKGSRPQSDLYALGVILYEALAGQRPFTGESQVEIAIAQVNRKHPPLPHTVSEPVRRLVDCMLSKKPEGRPQSGAKLAIAARALIAGDVAAAEAAVPQMLPGNRASEAITQVFNSATPTQATRVLPNTAVNPVVADNAGADDLDYKDPVYDENPKKSKGAAIAIIVLVIIALVSIGWGVWQFAGSSDEPTERPTATASAGETAATITINPNDYIGQTSSTARANIENLGLTVRTVNVESNEAAGTVVGVRAGNNGYEFAEGDTVTLEVSTGPAIQEENPDDSRNDSGNDSGDDSDLGGSNDSGSDSGGSGNDSGNDSGTGTSNDSGSDSGGSGNDSGNDSGTSNDSGSDSGGSGNDGGADGGADSGADGGGDSEGAQGGGTGINQ